MTFGMVALGLHGDSRLGMVPQLVFVQAHFGGEHSLTVRARVPQSLCLGRPLAALVVILEAVDTGKLQPAAGTRTLDPRMSLELLPPLQHQVGRDAAQFLHVHTRAPFPLPLHFLITGWAMIVVFCAAGAGSLLGMGLFWGASLGDPRRGLPYAGSTWTLHAWKAGATQHEWPGDPGHPRGVRL